MLEGKAVDVEAIWVGLKYPSVKRRADSLLNIPRRAGFPDCGLLHMEGELAALSRDRSSNFLFLPQFLTRQLRIYRFREKIGGITTQCVRNTHQHH